MALNVLETEESIPPEIPITKDCAFEGIPSAYDLIQFDINFVFSLGFMTFSLIILKQIAIA
jgi:hypothetical protein